ncbi:hypothetical protein [Dysgonomonas sp. HGC4]|uniref:hypothetical protein n=1 Tax=Dysgonomonas sp. HGC4 TaxID=1658009 RepID=UPI0006801F10|nr:hypothetical protein [Dysgonomonas sp. HGC4]MBD8346592.1 hypothetical protein [Dysgonomonas sp. HGC4]
MKKALLVAIIVIVSLSVKSQTSTITNWNTLKQSGFYESKGDNSINAPQTSGYWFWGINLAHSSNALITDKPYHFGAQLVFEANFGIYNPKLYIRSTNVDGEGIWAKVLTDKGDQEIAGKLKAREIEVTISAGADHVFSNEYGLKSLTEVEAFVKENKHLPEIPSEKQMVENGLNINEFQIKLLQKIEELTLYVINQDKVIKEQSKLIEDLQERFDQTKD